MDLLFNELSIAGLYADKYAAKDTMEQFVGAVATARRKGFGYRQQVAIIEKQKPLLNDWMKNIHKFVYICK
jgi:hypothetical protein